MATTIKVGKQRGQLVLVDENNKQIGVQGDMKIHSPLTGRASVTVEFFIDRKDFKIVDLDAFYAGKKEEDKDVSSLVDESKPGDSFLITQKHEDKRDAIKEPLFPEDRIA